MNEIARNAHKTIIFRQLVAAGSSGYLTAPLVSHGVVSAVSVTFAPGESGTLHLRPMVELPGEIMIDLFDYATNGLQYVSGDDETVKSSVQYEIENYSTVKIWYENTGTEESFVNVNVEVMYFEIIEPANVIGPQQKRRFF
jgi:hypothetical protein